MKIILLNIIFVNEMQGWNVLVLVTSSGLAGGTALFESFEWLSSGGTVTVGGAILVTSLCSGGETLDGDQIRTRCSPPYRQL